MTLAQRIKLAMDLRKAKPVDVARACGITAVSVSNLLSGASKSMKAKTSSRMAAFLHVSERWLVEEIGAMETGGQAVATAELDKPWGALGVDREHFAIPQFDVRAAMGDGAFPADHVEVVRRITVSVPELRKQASFTSPQNLSFISGYGHSMEPLFKDGDVLLVDQGVRQVDVDAVYVAYLNGKLYIKTFMREPDKKGTLVMISESNKKSYVIKDEDELDIQGRVVLAWNARRL